MVGEYLLDTVLDVLTIVLLYLDGDYVYMGVLWRITTYWDLCTFFCSGNISGLKITASAFSIVFSFAFILHKNRVSYFPEAKKIWSSSIVYFLWNLLLMTPRVIAIALFASVLPCYIPLHFLCLWLLLFLWARMEKANILYTSQSEWLYQATVGLIWYFSWYTVSTKNTRVKNNIYHVCMGADMTLLLGLWFWRRSVESAHLGPPPVNLYVMIGVLPSLHLIGFLIKLFYYWKFNPSVLTTTVGRETHLQRKLAAMNDSVVAEIESSKQNPDQPVLLSTGS
ncbi:XK-related protein 8-like [Hoplias malabaricus]|uniref:XK-related protein 8-like n=1 Tax=Hoplias malabaricus TaxID=27720 RepID=UPI003461858A